MRHTFLLATGVLLALSVVKSAADVGDDQHPIVVAPDQAVVQAGGSRNVRVTVAAPDAPAEKRPRASLIVYKPDGTMRKMGSKLLRGTIRSFRVPLGFAPQTGTYTAYATVEVETQAFGMPTTFEVVSEGPPGS